MAEAATQIETSIAQERERASDPTTDARALFDLARHFPREVLANHGLDLLSLEDPKAWRNVSARARQEAAKLDLAPLLHSGAGQRPLRLFAAACAVRMVDGWVPTSKARYLCTPERVRAVATVARHLAHGTLVSADLVAVQVICDAWRRVNVPMDRLDGRALDAGGVLLIRSALTAAKRASVALTTRGRLETNGDGTWASLIPAEWEWQVRTLDGLWKGPLSRPPAEELTEALAVLRGSP